LPGAAYNAQASAFDQLQEYDSAIRYLALAEPARIEAADTAGLAFSFYRAPLIGAFSILEYLLLL